MPEKFYVPVPIKTEEFLKGRNPASQPGVELPHYRTMEDAQNKAQEYATQDQFHGYSIACVFEVEPNKAAMEKLINQGALAGTATVNLHSIKDAVMRVTNNHTQSYQEIKSSFFGESELRFDKMQSFCRLSITHDVLSSVHNMRSAASGIINSIDEDMPRIERPSRPQTALEKKMIEKLSGKIFVSSENSSANIDEGKDDNDGLDEYDEIK